MLVLYGNPKSPPCRTVTLIMDKLDLKYEYKILEMYKGDHLTPEYLKLNPQHTMPLLMDGDFKLAESRAIICYLAEKFDTKGALYPKDNSQLKAKINERLYFDLGFLYKTFVDFVDPVIFEGKQFPKEGTLKMTEMLKHANDFVAKTGFVAESEHATLADYAFLITYSTLKSIGDLMELDFGQFADLEIWFDKMRKEAVNYEANEEGAFQMAQRIRQIWK